MIMRGREIESPPPRPITGPESPVFIYRGPEGSLIFKRVINY
jgi:hypothetical protein